MKIKRYIPYKNITFCCRDCGTQISWVSALHGQGRCRSCATKGKNHPLFGKHLSKEHRENLSKALNGRKLSKEHIKKISGKHAPFFGKHHTKETLLKMSKSLTGKNNPNYGKKFSKEHRLKLSKSRKGRKISKETRLKISKANKGKKRSKESKLKMSKAKKGKSLSKEHRIKLSKILSGKNNHFFGKHHSKESKEKMSIALTGKYPSKEARLKMSKARRGNKNNLGNHHSKETKLKMSKTRKGKNNGNWRGGLSFLPYTQNFSKDLKLKIRYRDNHVCQNCGITEKEHGKNLSVHHIDYDKQNCEETNLITTCTSCNSIANSNRDYWFAYYTYIIEHFKELVSTFPTLR